MQDLKLTLVQAHLFWSSPEKNRNHIEGLLSQLEHVGDLIILPEMFSTGFNMEPKEHAEKQRGPTEEWMKKIAQKYDAAITGSIIVEEDSKFFNRLLFVTPEDQSVKYDKRHLFGMAGEHEQYSSGSEKLIVEWRSWRIRPLICYDLRFPVWARNRNDYDLLIYVANWPKPRASAWDALLKARSIANYAFCVGVNRIGEDANDIVYEGGSIAYDPKGEAISKASNVEQLIQCTISKQSLEEYRAKFPVHLDADDFTINP